MENFTNEEKDYYELLVDLLDNGDISDSERNILNKRKEKYSISDSRANEIEEFAKQERLKNLKPQNDSETSYYELILDFMENGIVSESSRKILSKRMEKYGIAEARAKELEDFAKQEYLESKKVKFESEEEKEYYEFIVDLMENGNISENNRKILDKRKIKFGISETRAKELEEFAKSNNSDTSNDLLEEGKAYYNNEEYDKAIEIFKKAIELNPNDDDSCRWLGNSYRKNEQIEDAIKYHLKAIELNPDKPVNWSMLGSSYTENGQKEEAIKCCLKATELNPNDYEELHNLGIIYRFNELYEKSIQTFIRTTELNSNDYRGWLNLGTSYYLNEQFQEAIEPLLKSVELNSNEAFSFYLLGNIYEFNGQYEEAIKYLLKSKEINPDSFEGWYELGCSYYGNGEYEEAINSLLKAVELNPDNSDNWRELGCSYYFNEQYQEAIDSLLKAVELNPDENSWRLLGMSYRFNEQYEKAMDSFIEMIKLNPDNDFNWYLVGDLSYSQGLYEDAAECLKKSIELGNDGLDTWEHLGNAYSNLENYAEAVKCYEYILNSEQFELDTDFLINFGINYGVALANLNRTEESIEMHKQVLDLDPNNEMAKNNLQILQSSNEGASLNGIVSGISKGIDTLNEISGKIDPKTVGLIMGAAGFIGKILGGSNKDKS